MGFFSNPRSTSSEPKGIGGTCFQGSIKTLVVTSLHCPLTQHRSKTHFIWDVEVYNLPQILSMNITFDYIYFSPQSINPCYFASLTIMWSSAMLKYCGGLHPKMTIFSDFKVTIYMTVYRLSVEFRMQFSHSVMDNDKIETLSVPSDQKQTNIEV